MLVVGPVSYSGGGGGSEIFGEMVFWVGNIYIDLFFFRICESADLSWSRVIFVVVESEHRKHQWQ